MDAFQTDIPQFLETNPLAKGRIEAIEREIAEWAGRPIEFSFDPSGTQLFSMEEMARAFARRSDDFAKSIRSLLSIDHVIPATVVGRALIETVGMACLFLHDMDRLIASGNLERFNVRLEKYYAGIKGQSIEPVHVMDAIRHLQKIDAAYVQYLDSKHDMLSMATEIAEAAGHTLSREKFAESLSVMKNYDLLSEVSHPNGIGTQFIYGEPSVVDDTVQALRRRFHQASLMSIWSCHHLLAALEKHSGSAERYRQKFMKGAG